MHGFIVIDKPAGMSSFQVVRQVRRLFSTKKVGHAGTLDPTATGVLPIALGEATKLLQYLLDGDKEYWAELTLGVETDSQDAEGEIVAKRPLDGVTTESVASTITDMVGVVDQIPPMHSALKRDGVPLYKLARQGVEVERKARRITIKDISIDQIELPKASFTVQCSKGTYVRTICHDIGQQLGCGAHLTGLRRTASARFTLADSVNLDTLEQLSESERAAALLSLSAPFHRWPQLALTDEAYKRLRNGIPPVLSEVDAGELNTGDTVFLTHKGVLQALTHFEPERLQEKRGDFRLLKVFNL